MIKTKDGYAKLIGTTYSGSVSRVLLSNGGDHILGNSNGNIPLNNGTVNTNLNADMLDGLHIHTGRNNGVNKIVRTDASGYILAGWINTTSSDIGTGAINKIYCSNDDYIRYKTPANFFPTLANSGNNISITVAGLNRTLTVGYATNTDKLDGYHAESFIKKHTEYSFSSNSTAPYNYVWLCRIGNSRGHSGMAITFDVNSRYHKHYQINMLISTGQYAYSSSTISINKSDSAPNVYYVRTANSSDVGYDYFDIYVVCGAWNYGGYKIINTNESGKLQFTNKCTLVDSLPSGATAVGLMYSGNYKTLQTAVSNPTALGTSTTFIDTISLNTNGVITVTKKTVPTMSGATASAAGTIGMVPAPDINLHTLFLKGDGTWATPSDTHWTTHLYIGAKDKASNAATTNNNTYIKVTDNSTIRNQYLIKGAGRAIVTSDANGNITITSPTVTWNEISGKPSTFAPSTHNHPTSQINALTSYTKATAAAALATSDSLNIALGKLEYKLDIAYDLVTKANDSDGTIENLKEILDVLAGIKDTETIKAIIGKYLPLSGGTMTLGEGLKFHADDNYFGTNLDARIISLLDSSGATCDGGLIIDERGTNNGTTTITELLRIRDAEFKWKGLNILHAGNSNIKNGIITINGTSITPLTSHQSLANYVTLNTALTISGVKTFSTLLKFTVAQGTSPFTVTSNTKVTNLNADLLDGYHASSFLIDKGHDYKGLIYELSCKSIFSGNNLSDAPTTGWVSGIVLGSNWNSSHYQHYLVEIGSRWYTTRTYSDGKMTNWNTFAYLTDNVASASKWQIARKITLSGSVTGSVSIDGSGDVTLATTTNHTHNYAGSPSAGGAANSANVLNSNSRMDYGWNGVNYFNAHLIAGCTAKANDAPVSEWWHIMRFNHGNSNGYYTDLAIPLEKNSLYWKRVSNGKLAVTSWVKILDSLNYNEYAPTKTGGGASGTWGISISGNATSATKLATARSIFGKSFNGTANVSGQGLFYGTYTSSANARYLKSGLLIRENDLVQNNLSDISYAPSIGFHWGSKAAATMLLHSDGNFYFRKIDGVTRASLDANIIGNASTATALTSSAGSATTPIYFSSGKPVACTYSLNKTVPSDAVFTDHTYNFYGVAFYSGNAGNLEHNANSAVSNGLYYYTSNGPTTTLGASNTDGALYVLAHSSSWVGQIALDYRNGGLYVRGKSNGTWTNWVTVLDSRNYNSYVSPKAHTHSVKINGSTKTIAATGGAAVDLGTYLTAHLSVSNKAVTLAWGTSSTIATIGSTDITVTLPTISNIDTKNTAGSTDTSSKIFLIGATSLAANPLTYSHDTAYVGTDGCLYSGSKKVSVNGHTHSYLPLAGGTMNANARIALESSNLYIGTSTSTGWVYLLDMASLKGADYWAIALEGGAYFKTTVTASTFIGALSGNATTATTASKLGSSTVGSGIQHFYLSAGTATASSATVGSASRPMYLKAGVMTACSSSLTDYLPLTGGNLSGDLYVTRTTDASVWTRYLDKTAIRMVASSSATFIQCGNYAWNDNVPMYITGPSSTEGSTLYLKFSTVDASGNILASHFYENSDIRYKRILKNLLINSNTIANLPLFDFEWIENNTIGTGTSAQAVLKILPNIVSGNEKLTLDYGVLGTIAGITACKELVKVNIEIFTLKSELLQLREKVKLLEDKLRKYENI